MSDAAVSVRHVVKRFGSHAAVDDVSLDILAGQSLVILGPSGCGKTTLLRLVAGLEAPTLGEVWLDGQRAATAGRIALPPHRRRLGYVFQDLALWPHLTVTGHLRFVLQALRVPRSERARRMHDVLTLCRVDHFADRYPHQLSGGEQQRVALARALVGSPHLLLLDEPLSSLDAELRSVTRLELAKLRKTLGLTAIYVTHDWEDASVLADRIVEMRAGKIVSDESSRSSD